MMEIQDQTTKLNESGQAIALQSALNSCRNEGFNMNLLIHGIDPLSNCVILLIRGINRLSNSLIARIRIRISC